MTEDTKKIAVELDAALRKLMLRWSDGRSSSYHYVWLRHHGKCPDGMPNDTEVKIDLLPEDPESLVVDKCNLQDDYLTIHWGDGIETRHRIDDLVAKTYASAERRRRRPPPCLWDSRGADEIPIFEFSEINADRGIFELQMAIRDFGIARMRNVPARAGTVASVAEWFGPVHVNNYGRVFDVRTDTNKSLGSNTGAYLRPHTDEGYRHMPPGISLFHCLEASQAGGGASILVDGFCAAQKLREVDSDCFDVLTRVPIFFQRQASDSENMQAHGRVIVLNPDGDIEGIRFSDRTLPPQDLPEHLIEPVYRALKRFWDILNSDELKFAYHMAPGDLHIFDNHRILHGRTEFDPRSGTRFLQQCSVSRDEFHNTLRLRAARHGHEARNQRFPGGALG